MHTSIPECFESLIAGGLASFAWLVFEGHARVRMLVRLNVRTDEDCFAVVTTAELLGHLRHVIFLHGHSISVVVGAGHIGRLALKQFVFALDALVPLDGQVPITGLLDADAHSGKDTRTIMPLALYQNPLERRTR